MSDNILEEINNINWWHCIDINGTVTPGANKESQDTFDHLGLPENMSGMTVLDIGAWDGFYSFACEKKNAERIVAADKFVWERKWEMGGGVYATGDAGFELARRELGSKVEKLIASVEDLQSMNIGKFDVVLMLGVIYHAKNPMQYLEIAKSLCSGTVYIETHVDMLDFKQPAARYYVGDELNKDATNYWGCNPPAVRGMMQDLGYHDITDTQLRTGNRWIFRGSVK